MERKDYNLYSNSELKLMINEVENEFEALKVEISKKLSKMDELNDKYNALNDVLKKRTKGFVV